MGTVRYNVLNGRVLSETRNGVQRDYQTDATGNTLALWDNTQTKTDTFDYFAYGKVANRTGTTTTPFQFGGGLGYYQNDSNRTHVRARNFYVNLGKWSSQDPIGFNGRDYNLYRYANNNPVRWTDPSGLVVDSYNKVTNLWGFLNAGSSERFLYTCRCGWMDKSHVFAAIKAAFNMRKHYRTHIELSVETTVFRVNSYAGSGSWGGFELVGAEWQNTHYVQPYAFNDLSAYIAYRMGWEVEAWEASAPQNRVPQIGLSAWSYEDLPSDWMGVMAFWRWHVPEADAKGTLTRLLKECKPMKLIDAQKLYTAMESYCPLNHAMCHRDDSFKYNPGKNINPLEHLPAKNYFHTWVGGGPYKDCCGIVPKAPPILRIPANLYTDTMAHFFVKELTNIWEPDITVDI